ncbi:hypothetical protein F5Y16DRAFT_423946 [Xylariaceae sp. FL0255]|nr:hypothetical protein F5Y16DRAFT_423946 [Xylariaceae sp. FL0255]
MGNIYSRIKKRFCPERSTPNQWPSSNKNSKNSVPTPVPAQNTALNPATATAAAVTADTTGIANSTSAINSTTPSTINLIINSTTTDTATETTPSASAITPQELITAITDATAPRTDPDRHTTVSSTETNTPSNRTMVAAKTKREAPDEPRLPLLALRLLIRTTKIDGFEIYKRLPIELRVQIWKYIMPSRVVCLRDPVAYTGCQLLGSLRREVRDPDAKDGAYKPKPPKPKIYPKAFFRDILERSELKLKGLEFLFFLQPEGPETPSNQMDYIEPWEYRKDILFLPSMRVFTGWKFLTPWSHHSSATVMLNALDVIEDRYRGSRGSDLFTSVMQNDILTRVRHFQLALLTVECGADLPIYDGELRAVVDLDDENLMDYIRPVYERDRNGHTGCGHTRHKNKAYMKSRVPHKTPFKLVQHLRSEWDKDIKRLFEEQWLRSAKDKDERLPPEAYTNERFGYKNKKRFLDRTHRSVEPLVRQMPTIKPVIVFEKRWFCDEANIELLYGSSRMYHIAERIDFSHPQERIWNAHGQDGMKIVSNRRGMVLSRLHKVGLRTMYPGSIIRTPWTEKYYKQISRRLAAPPN